MRKFIKCLGFPLCCLLSLAVGVLPALAADNSPQETMRQAIAALKTSGRITVLSDFTDWQFIYELRGPKMRSESGDTSVAEYRRKTCELFENPDNVMRAKFLAHRDERLSEEQIEELAAQSAKQIREQSARYAAASYSVGDAKIAGDLASVDLEVASGGAKSIVKVPLHLQQGRWLIAIFPFQLPVEAPDKERRVSTGITIDK